MNWRFIVRGLALAVGALALMGLGLYLALPSLLLRIPFGPTPEAPLIEAPQGTLPDRWPGLETWAAYLDQQPRLVGSGFYLRLPDGVITYVSAAHSFDLAAGLERVIVGADHLTRLYGEPGVPRLFGSDLRNDYMLFVPEGQLERDLIGEPDRRGAPQPGERVALYPGIAESASTSSGERQRPLLGTILSVDQGAAWVVMDEAFAAGLMSGSPMYSAHTGRIVGMALVAGEREGHTVIGLHPIGSLVEKGLASDELTPLIEFRE